MSIEHAEQALIALDPHPFYVPLGRWAPVVEGAFQGMSTRHWIFAGPRARIGASLRGANPERLLHPENGAKPYKLAPSSQHPARRALQAVGSALTTQQPTLCILGDAALAHGHVMQALELCVQHKCPVVFLIIRFPLTADAPISKQSSINLAHLAQSYQLGHVSVAPKKESIQKAIQEACAQNSPILIETLLEK